LNNYFTKIDSYSNQVLAEIDLLHQMTQLISRSNAKTQYAEK